MNIGEARTEGCEYGEPKCYGRFTLSRNDKYSPENPGSCIKAQLLFLLKYNDQRQHFGQHTQIHVG